MEIDENYIIYVKDYELKKPRKKPIKTETLKELPIIPIVHGVWTQ